MSASIPSWARVGTRVVCVDVSDLGNGAPAELCINEVYTITWVGQRVTDHCAGLMVEGLSVMSDLGVPFAYNFSRFRPLVSDSDELGIETQLYRAKGRTSKVSAREPERA